MTVQNIVVAGKSGAGKQPRVDVLVQTYGLRQLATGNIFREYLGTYNKVRAASKTDGLWANEKLASDATIRQALAPACAQAGAAVNGFGLRGGRVTQVESDDSAASAAAPSS